MTTNTPSSNDTESMWTWFFYNLAGCVYVRFIVFGDTEGTDPIVLAFLVPLIIASCVGSFLCLISSAWKTFVAQAVLTSYTIWLVVCFGAATSFPPDENVSKQLEAEIEGFDWQSLPGGTFDASTFSNNPRNGLIIIIDRKRLSPLFWHLPISSRARSLNTAATLVLVNVSTVDHPDAEWIRVTPSGETISAGKVKVTFWETTVVDYKAGRVANLQFRGEVAAGRHNLLGLPPQIEPTEAFINHFNIPMTKWTHFFYPEATLFRMVVLRRKW